MNCLHCGAATSNGLGLCELAQRKASTDLEFLPVYFRNLARWRPPARPNGSVGTSGQWLIRRGDSEGSLIGHGLARAVNDLTTWARALADDRGVEPPAEAETEAEMVAELCAWLAEHLTSIATLEWAGQFVRDIDRHEAILRALTEASVPGWYSGTCRRRIAMETDEDPGLCAAPTYVVPGLTWVTCAACGSTTYARDHLDAVVDEARDWIAVPKRLAEVIVALVDTEQSIEDLRKRIAIWGSRGHIKCHRPTNYAPKRYQLGDVLDEILIRATRGDEVVDAS